MPFGCLDSESETSLETLDKALSNDQILSNNNEILSTNNESSPPVMDVVRRENSKKKIKSKFINRFRRRKSQPPQRFKSGLENEKPFAIDAFVGHASRTIDEDRILENELEDDTRNSTRSITNRDVCSHSATSVPQTESEKPKKAEFDCKLESDCPTPPPEPIPPELTLEEKYEKIIRIIECINAKIDECKLQYFKLICRKQGDSPAADLCRRNVETLACLLRDYARKASDLQCEDPSKVWANIPLATSLEEDYMEISNDNCNSTRNRNYTRKCSR